MYIRPDRAFISRCARGTCYYFVVYRALVVNMHGIYCHGIVYRHAQHIRLSFVYRASADMHGTYCYPVSQPCIFCLLVGMHGMYSLISRFRA